MFSACGERLVQVLGSSGGAHGRGWELRWGAVPKTLRAPSPRSLRHFSPAKLWLCVTSSGPKPSGCVVRGERPAVKRWLS